MKYLYAHYLPSTTDDHHFFHRHPMKGSADIAASVSDKPIINAGDGTGEHPTQVNFHPSFILIPSSSSFLLLIIIFCHTIGFTGYLYDIY